ncbi:hypothetical protein TNCV_4978341 [Trichonephila clavipes]|nr:hypothetical protein TNCV_4978341 [Trichonephila clavipes]
MIPARTWPYRAAYSSASGLSGSVTGTTVVEKDAIQQGLQKEAVASLTASVTVPILMDDPRHQGGEVKP